MRYYFFGFIFLLSIVISCNSDNISSYEVGSDFLENEIDISIIDTFSIKSSTYKYDSIITSSTGRILLGHIDDEYLGTLTSNSYFQLSNSTFSIDSDAEFHSAGFVLNYDNYYYGDTTAIQTYTIYELSELMESDDNDDYFYNTSSINYFEDNPLGSISITPKPINTQNDSIFIPLTNASLSNGSFEQLFLDIQDGNISSETEFLSEFKGLAITANKNNSNFIGFNVTSTENTSGNSSLRMYYTLDSDNGDDINNDDDDLNYIDFVVLDAAKQFNSVESNLNANSFDFDYTSIQEDEKENLYGVDTDNKVFSQGISGICTKFEMRSLSELNKIAEYGSVLSASLTFNPSPGSYDKNNILPESLNVYIINQNNRIQQQLFDIDGNAALAILSKESEFPEDTFYTIDVTAFVQTILSSETDLNYGLMIQVEGANESANRVIIDDFFAETSQLKLSVKYLNY